MKMFNCRAAALGSALLASTCLAPPALAQNAPPAPVRETIDANGVDLFRGTMAIDETLISIGQDGGLSYGRSFRGTGWRENIAGSIWLSGDKISVSLGAFSDRFTVSGASYIPTEGNGSTLTFNSSTQIYTYRKADGTIALFDRNMRRSDYHYYNEGRVRQVTSPNGERLDHTYDEDVYCEYREGDFCTGGYRSAFRLASVSNAYGYRLSFSYQYPDQLEDAYYLGSWETVTGAKLVNVAVEACPATATPCATANSWPGVGELAHTTLSDNNSYIGGTHGITGIRRPGSGSNDVTIGYTNGKVSSVANHSGTTQYAYADQEGYRIVTVTDPVGQPIVYTFAIASERMASVRDALQRTTSYQYDGSGRLTHIIRPEGNYTLIAYDGRGNVTGRTEVAKPGSGLASIASSASFPLTCANPVTCNQPASTTDARGKVTNYSYSSTHGGLLSVTAPAAPNGVRPETRYGYTSYTSATGASVTRLTGIRACRTQASCVGTADEVKTAIGYTSGNVLPASVSQGSGDGALTATTAMTYDMVGNLVTVDGPLPGPADTARLRYDAIRRRVGEVGPDPDGGGALKHRARRVTYAASGLVQKVETGTVADQSDAAWDAFAPLEAVTITHDADGRPVRQALSAGGTTHAVTDMSYDAASRPACAATRMNPLAWGTLTPACTLQAQGGDGPDRITRTVHDAVGRLSQVQTGYAVAADHVAWGATFRPNGQVEVLIDGEGNRTVHEYDGHDRLQKTMFPVPAKGSDAGSTTDYELLTLDAAGNVTQRRLRDGQVIGYTYDNLGRLTYIDNPLNASSVTDADVSLAHDNLGRLKDATDSHGHFARYTYDALGRTLTEASLNGGTKAMAYDLGGRMTRLTHRDGFYALYEYNVAGDPHAVWENGTVLLAQFTHDDLGRRTSLTRGNGTTTSYVYDAVSRLSQLSHDIASAGSDLTLTFTYTPASQIKTRSGAHGAYAFGGLASGTTSYTANGLNQYTAVGSAAPTHDARGNLTGDGSGTTYGYNLKNQLIARNGSTQLYYEPLGRLTQQWNGGSILDWVGSALVAETDGTTVLRRYVHGPGTDEPLVWYEGSGTGDKRYLHADERGSIVAVSDANGNVIAYNAYDDYGMPQTHTGAGTLYGRFGFTGQVWLPEVGLYYFKARMYHPGVPTFMQLDPIYPFDGMNGYAYVGNDPINFTDPTGMKRFCVGAEGETPNCTDPFGPSAGSLGSPGLPPHTEDRGDPDACLRDARACIFVTGQRVQRTQLKTISAAALYSHYVWGTGATVCLTGQQFQNLMQAGEAQGEKTHHPSGGYTQAVSFYNLGSIGFALGLGSSRGNFSSDGAPTGFYDNYDFDKRDYFGSNARPWSLVTETITRIGAEDEKIGAKPFEIKYPC